MGRGPRHNERVFFFQHIEPLPEVQADTVRAMRKAGIPEQLIYAYEKTGLVLSERSVKTVAKQDLDDYNTAIDEFFDLGGDYYTKKDEMECQLDRVQYVLSITIDKFLNKRGGPWSKLDSEFIRCYPLVAATRNIRAFRILMEKKAVYDALSILRSI